MSESFVSVQVLPVGWMPIGWTDAAWPRMSVLEQARAASATMGPRSIAIESEHWREVFSYIGGRLEEYRLIEKVKV